MPDWNRFARRRERLGKSVPNRGLLTAETLAIATALGYALAFVYQWGVVAYYGVPAETIRVSPEWVIFLAFLMVPFVLSGIAGFVAGNWMAGAKRRRALRIVASLIVSTSYFAAFFVGVFGDGVLAWLGLALGGLTLATAFADLLSNRLPRIWAGVRRSVMVLLPTALVLFVVVFVNYLGAQEASLRKTYLVDTTQQRVLVYSTDTVYVFADYDATTHQLKPRLTYRSSESFGTAGLTLVNTTTGRLRAAVAGR